MTNLLSSPSLEACSLISSSPTSTICSLFLQLSSLHLRSLSLISANRHVYFIDSVTAHLRFGIQKKLKFSVFVLNKNCKCLIVLLCSQTCLLHCDAAMAKAKAMVEHVASIAVHGTRQKSFPRVQQTAPQNRKLQIPTKTSVWLCFHHHDSQSIRKISVTPRKANELAGVLRKTVATVRTGA